jgi:hypothetical protein
MAWTDALVRRAESLEAVDRPAGWLSPIVTRFTHRPPRASILGGMWLGHPLHPVLTDVPIGCWTSAVVLDLLGGTGSRKAAQRLIGLGVAAAVPIGSVVTGPATAPQPTYDVKADAGSYWFRRRRAKAAA